MGYLRSRLLPVAVLSAVGAGLLVAPALLGVHRVPAPEAGPLDLADYRAALEAAVVEGGVRYDRIHEEPGALARFLGGLARIGPRSNPERFPTTPERLAYYLNAYNALVLQGIVVHGVKSTLHEVRGTIEPTPGFGFFWATRFTLDGEDVHLYGLENEVIREFGDARIHAAINCASRSCPPLRPEPFEAARLDEQLDDAARGWVADPNHVRIDEQGVRLNPIFDWFRTDFEAHAEKLGEPPTVLAWIAHHLPPERAEAMRAAEADGTPVRFFTYDWSLNRAPEDASKEGR